MRDTGGKEGMRVNGGGVGGLEVQAGVVRGAGGVERVGAAACLRWFWFAK